MTKIRIPITAITVFGTSALLVLSVGIVLYLGFNQAAESTRQLWAEQSRAYIDSIEQSLDAKLEPVKEQATWIASDLTDISKPELLDEFMFGALAATPQAVGLAVVTATGVSRRWHREKRIAITEDWSNRSDVMLWLKQVENENRAAWRDPIWAAEPVGTTTLLHDVPLYNSEGHFIGALAHVIPVNELSRDLSRYFSDIGVTPFILYNRDSVLAHPSLPQLAEKTVLPKLEEIDDPVLRKIWTPDDNTTYIDKALINTQSASTILEGDFYLYLYRDIKRYGPAAWTIGAYINDRLIANNEVDRIITAMWICLLVLAFGLMASIIVGRKVSAPIKAIVGAANAIDSGEIGTLPKLGTSSIRELDDASNAFNNMADGLRERELIRDTLGRFVPEEIASSLLSGGGSIEVQQTEATILFCDIESFTSMTETLGPVKIVNVLNDYFSTMVDILERYQGVVTQFQGDAILATFNVPIDDVNHAKNAIQAAEEMLAIVNNHHFNNEKLNIRIGINTGQVVAGAIGAKGRLNYTVHGDAVNLAARIEEMNKQFGTRLLISGKTTALVSDISFSPVGETTVRGQSQSITLYTLK